MKKLSGIFFIVLCGLGLLSIANAQEVEITCPSGDTYKCYTTESGVTAYKGEGEAKVRIVK